jgi:HD-GYP domain-containing protein (c-di-GMP phosphodiesterase class II)
VLWARSLFLDKTVAPFDIDSSHRASSIRLNRHQLTSPIAGAVLPIKRAEDLILTLPGVVSAKILVGDSGKIDQIHVLTTQEIPAKQVVRNIERELLDVMVAAIEARDPFTSGHSRRVAANARVIGRAIGLRARDIDRICIAALLHDVGKIH